MTLGTILYILLFFVSVFISIMYLEFGAMALMGLMVTIPVCMFLFLLVLIVIFTSEHQSSEDQLPDKQY